MDQHKMKHLEMIQGIINRLAGCSFLLKGWSVTLVAALFALSDKDAEKSYYFIAYIPTVIFWGLDGYFLWQERLFRHLYGEVAMKDEGAIDFKMDTRLHANREAWSRATLSLTLTPFYLSLVIAIQLVISLT